jgi:Amt family ammonium transporter
MGKYAADGSVRPIPGHNMSLATLGTLILWLGWFGFNPGSTMAADAAAISKVALNTNMAAAAGCLTATATAWLALGKPDLSMILNGTLAGLVAITAPCNSVGLASSVIIGAIAGVLVVFSVIFFDRKAKVDDPVGALSVHLVNGVWGTLSVGLFASDGGLFFGGGFGKTLIQLTGIASIGVVTAAASALAWFVLKATMGIRVTAEEEYQGLDTGEHGMEAYPGFSQVPSELSVRTARAS